MFGRDVLMSLASADPGPPILSVYARTDPRDPANSSHSPAWEVALRNGLRAVGERLERDGARDERLAFRALRERVIQELVAQPLAPSERARSVAWFVTSAGETRERLGLQLPVRRDVVVWDARPFVSPLVDVADRGAAAGIVLVSGDRVRLLAIEQAEISEPADGTYELELGDWRTYGGTASGSPARGLQTTAHEERYRARVDAQRDKLFDTAATATARRLSDLGWERLVVASEGQVLPRFLAALPAAARERVAATAERNLMNLEPPAIADALEPILEKAWLRETRALSDLAAERAAGGGAAAVGVQQTLQALADARVDHLVLDPAADLAAGAGTVPESIPGPRELLAERAVEAAIAQSAKVTAVPMEESPSLQAAGGLAALLRY